MTLTNKKGFTLVEILAAIVILSVTTVSLTTILMSSLLRTTTVNRTLVAEQVATQYTNLTVAHLKQGKTVSFFNGLNALSNIDDEGNKFYNFDDSTEAKMKMVELFDSTSLIYIYMYGEDADNNLLFAGTVYNYENVGIKLTQVPLVSNTSSHMYEIEITVTYMQSRKAVSVRNVYLAS